MADYDMTVRAVPGLLTGRRERIARIHATRDPLERLRRGRHAHTPGSSPATGPSHTGATIRRDIDEMTLALVLSLGGGDPKGEATQEAMPVITELTDALRCYLNVASGPAPSASPALLRLHHAAETAEETAIRMREDRAEDKPGAKTTEVLANLRTIARDILVDTRPLIEKQDLANDAARYATARQATLGALKEGSARHLMITPQPGSREARGSGQLYPADIPPDKEMQLALPTRATSPSIFGELKANGTKPAILDVLALGGGHGGVNATFEESNEYRTGSQDITYSGKPFEKQYWQDNVVKPMADRGIKAKLIVLDACLTASMIDVFEPLCAPGGKIMASMYSINAKVMTPEVWSKVISAEGSAGVRAVTESAQLVNEGATQHAIHTLFGLIRTGAPGDVQDLVTREPGIKSLVSRIRYLPRIFREMNAFLRAKADARRRECVQDLRAIQNAQQPPVDAADAETAGMVAELLAEVIDNQGDLQTCYQTAREVLGRRLKDIADADDGEIADLLELVDTASRAGLESVGLGEVPAQVAVYDHDRKEIRYDKLFTEQAARKRIEDSTGAESAREMRLVEAELATIAKKLGATLKPVPTGQVVGAWHEGPSIVLTDPEGAETALL